MKNILTYDKSNIDILIPEKARGNKKQKSYFDFYKFNLDNDISILKDINNISTDIDKFVQTKIDSYGEII